MANTSALITLGATLEAGPTLTALRSFWAYAKRILSQYNGVSPKNFPLYLKEVGGDLIIVKIQASWLV